MAIRGLNKSNISCKAFGYYQKTTHLAITPANEIIMMTVFLEKDPESTNFEILID
jgi:hypothetical protein